MSLKYDLSLFYRVQQKSPQQIWYKSILIDYKLLQHASRDIRPTPSFQCGHIQCPYETWSVNRSSHFRHTASAAASCNPQKYQPDKQQNVSARNRQSQRHVVSSGTYRDVSVQRLSIGLQVLLSDVQHVHLRAGHHDTDEGSVLGASSLV